MELEQFAAEFPEFYAMLYDTVNSTINSYNMSGEDSLRNWDDMIDSFVRSLENDDLYGQEMKVIASQQMPYDGFGRDRGRRRFRNFNVRDIIRLLFLRQLFDRNRF